MKVPDGGLPRGPVPRRGLLRVVIVVTFFILVMGLWIDLLGGLQLTRGARSLIAWVTGIVGLGILYLIGEAGAEWIAGPDKVTDPLSKRVLRLLALLGLVAALIIGMSAVYRAVS